MTTMERSPIRVAMERAAQRINDEYGDAVVTLDMLTAFTQAAEAQTVGVDNTEAYAELKRENAELADQLAARQRSLEETEEVVGQLRRDLEDTDDERTELRRQLDRLTADRLTLQHALTAAQQTTRKQPKQQPHRHAYPWSSPDELPGPCECGHPFPRAAEEDDEEVVPDLTPWDELMERVRVELELAGWPPEATDG